MPTMNRALVAPNAPYTTADVFTAAEWYTARNVASVRAIHRGKMAVRHLAGLKRNVERYSLVYGGTKVFFDFSATFNGDGTAGNQAASNGAVGARNTITGYTRVAGHRMNIRRGTTMTGTLTIDGITSSAGSPFIIEPYFYNDGTDEPGMPRPVIDHAGGSNGVGAIFIRNCQHVIVRGMAGTRSLAAGGSAVRLYGSRNVQVYDCEGFENTHGCSVAPLVGTADCLDIDIDDSDWHHNLGSGVHMHYGAASGATVKRIRVRGNNVRQNGLGSSASTRGGIMTQNGTPGTTDANYAIWDIIVEDNDLSFNRSYAMNIYGARTETYPRNRVRFNFSDHSGYTEDIDTHGLWVGASINTDVHFNHVQNTHGWVGGSVGSGVSIFIDINATTGQGCDNVSVVGNWCHDGWQEDTSATLPGSGVHVIAGTNVTVDANLIERCGNGISFSGSGSSGNIAQGNTLLDIGNLNQTGTRGYAFVVNAGSATIRQNVTDKARVGIFKETSATLTESNNLFHDCTINRRNGSLTGSQTDGTLDASDRTDDPLLDDEARPLANSPIRFAGTDLGTRMDFYGMRRSTTPSWGALD